MVVKTARLIWMHADSCLQSDVWPVRVTGFHEETQESGGGTDNTNDEPEQAHDSDNTLPNICFGAGGVCLLIAAGK